MAEIISYYRKVLLNKSGSKSEKEMQLFLKKIAYIKMRHYPKR